VLDELFKEEEEAYQADDEDGVAGSAADARAQ
jgi:hypothetical protein